MQMSLLELGDVDAKSFLKEPVTIVDPKNPTALKLLIAMMEAGFGQKETEKLVKQVEKRR